ncbi:MAG: HEAT repeat domain-containing protein [Arachnia sp.]
MNSQPSQDSTTTISQIIETITHADRDVRLRAALDAGMLRTPEVTAALVQRIGEEEDFRVRENLTWALVHHGDDAVPHMLEKLSSENPLERRQAAHVLSKMGDPAHAPYLLPVVADENSDVAIKAYRAAASTGSPEVVGALVARLGDGEGEQRDALSNALQQLGAMTLDALISALKLGNAHVRTHAAEALAQLGQEAGPALPALEALSSDADTEVALAAVMAVGAVVDDESSAALLRIEDGGRQPLSAIARRFLNSRDAI